MKARLLALNFVPLAQEEEANGGRNHHNQDPSQKTQEEIGEGRCHRGNPDNDFDKLLLNIIDQLNTVNTIARLGGRPEG